MTIAATPLRCSGPLDHFEHGFNRICVSPDTRFTATSDVDMNVVVRDRVGIVFERNFVSENEKIRPTERVRGLAFSQDGEFMFVAAGAQLMAYRTIDWGPAWIYEAPRSFGFLIISPISLDTAENGDIAAAFDNGTTIVWDRNGLKKQVIRDNDSPRWLRFAAGGEDLVGSDSFSLCKWRVGQSRHKVKIRLQDRAFGLDVRKSGGVAAIRTLQDIVLWNLTEGSIIRAVPVGPGTPALAFHPTEDLLAFAERSRIRIIDLAGNPVRQLDVAATSALSLTFSPNGDELLIGCTEQTLVRQRL